MAEQGRSDSSESIPFGDPEENDSNRADGKAGDTESIAQAAMDDHPAAFWTMTLAVAIVHAYTLGQVLSYGSFLTSIQTEFGKTTTEAALIGDAQFGAFIAAGIAMMLINRTGLEFRTITEIMVLIWGMGMVVVSIIPDVAFDTFAGLYIALGGFGAGLLFWHTLSVIPSWARQGAKHETMGYDNRVIASYAIISMAPSAYQALNSYLFTINGHTRSFNMLYIVAIPGTVAMGFSALFIRERNLGVSNVGVFDSKPAQSVQEEMKEATKITKWSGAFYLFLTSVFLFQFAFYAPYVLIPDFAQDKFGNNTANGTVIDAVSESEVGATMAMLGTGSVVGRIFAVGMFMYVEYMWKHSFIDMNTMWWMGMCTVLLASWLAVDSWDGLKAWTFFYGVASSAATFCIVVRVLAKWPHNDTQSKATAWTQFKIACLCLFSLPGAVLSSYLTSLIVDAAGYAGGIAFNAGMAGAGFCTLVIFASMYNFTTPHDTQQSSE